MDSVNDYQENYKTGYISLYRSIKKHWIYNNDKYFKWWVTILFEVNHSDKKYLLYNDLYSIKKGQSSNSLRTWAKLLNTNTKSITKFFILLQKDDMIIVGNIGKGKRTTTLITIINFSKYQNNRNANVDANETQTKRKRDTNNNVNNYNKINIPTFLEFKIYAFSKSNNIDSELIKLKYESWVQNGWKDGNDKKIKNWKSKLLNTIPYLNTKQNYKSDAL